MKKNIFFTLLTLSFLLSCSSDSDTETPCNPIACLNNGISNSDCGCDCPQGFGGVNCGTVLTPSKVIITKVIIKAFDNLNTSGIGHDLANGPDIYIKINSGTTVLYDHPTFISNATAGLNTNYEFILNPILQVTNVNSPFIISLWDYDLGDTPSNADDNMASAAFFPFNGNNFPSSIVITDPSTATKFEIYFTYQW
jgi:hypothetical protein